MPPRNVVVLDHGDQIYWNGDPISGEQLRRYLRESHRMNPEPEVFLETEMGASCGMLDSVRDWMDDALACKEPGSRCAEGTFSKWRGLPTPPGTPPS